MTEWKPLTSADVPAFVECLHKYPFSMDDTIKEFPLQFYTLRIISLDTYYVKSPNNVYMALDPITPHDAVVHFIRDPLYRSKKQNYIDKGIEFMIWAFKTFNFNRLTLTVVAGLNGPFKIANLLGFTHEGTLRQCRIIDNQAHDVHIFSILRTEV